MTDAMLHIYFRLNALRSGFWQKKIHSQKETQKIVKALAKVLPSISSGMSVQQYVEV